jgi:hypothetical protein
MQPLGAHLSLPRCPAPLCRLASATRAPAPPSCDRWPLAI